MGDRALIHFHDGKEMSPCIYLHWGGESVPALLAKTRERMDSRGGDVSYTTARCVGIAHEESDGNLSLGVWNGPDQDYAKARAAMVKYEPYEWDKTRKHFPYSHGDAGVFLVDCRTWDVETFGGYGLGGYEADEDGAIRLQKLADDSAV